LQDQFAGIIEKVPIMDLSEVPPESVQELHRQAETCLSGTIQLGIAADQRATTLTGIFGAGSVAILAAIATVMAGSSPHKPFILGAAVMAALLFVAALTSAMAGAPADFHVGGYEPKRFIRSASDPVWMLRYAVTDMQDRIDFNRAVLERSAQRLRAAMVFALAAIPFGVMVFGILAR
jgi:hypothetical protein